MRNVDPTGLMLFAFDGTYNAPDKPTNIWHFYQAYDAQANGPGGDVLRPYLEGVGVSAGEHVAYGRTTGKFHLRSGSRNGAIIPPDAPST